MRYQLKRIDPMSVLKIGVAVGAVVGVATSLMVSLVSWTGPGGMAPLELLFVLANILMRGVLVGLLAALGAAIYNWLVRWTGGIEVELEPREKLT